MKTVIHFLALAALTTLTACADSGTVPTTRKINGKPLSSNIILTPADLGATATGAAIFGMSAPGNDMVMAWNGAGVLTPVTKASLAGVPTSRTINSKALTSNITLVPSDLGATTFGASVFGMSAPGNDMVLATNSAGVLTPVTKASLAGGGGANLTSGPVTSSGGVSSVANGALSVAMTNGLQGFLDGKFSLTGNNTVTGNTILKGSSPLTVQNSGGTTFASFDPFTGTLFVNKIEASTSAYFSGPATFSSISSGLYPDTTEVRDVGGSLWKWRDLTLSRDAIIGRNADVTGALQVGGNATIGDANTDTVAFNARVASGLIPSVDNGYSIGSPTNRWATGYVLDLFTDVVDTISLQTTGTTTLGDDTSDTITLTGRVASAIVPGVTASHDLGTSSLRFRDAYFSGNISALGTISGSSLSDTLMANVTDDLAGTQNINASFTLSNSHLGKLLLVSGNRTMTIPISGVRGGRFCVYVNSGGSLVADGVVVGDVRASYTEADGYVEFQMIGDYWCATILGRSGSIVGITGTLAQFNTAITDGDIQPLDADLTSWAAIARATGYDAFAATPSSGNLASLLTDETGTSGGFVRAGSPTLTTPNIGAATGTSVALTGQISTTASTASTSAATGALVVSGGGAFGANTSISGNLLMLPSAGVPRTIDFGAAANAPAIYLYNGGTNNRWGWGLRSGSMQFFGTTSAGHNFSWNTGGDLQTNGTNELMRLTIDNGNLLIGTSSDDAAHKLQVNGGIKATGPITEGVVALGTVTTASTISLATGTVVTGTLTASTACTFTMPSAVAGRSFSLYLKQAASTGNGSATFTGVKWSGGTAPAITATAGRMDILSFVSDGTNWYGTFIQNFTP